MGREKHSCLGLESPMEMCLNCKRVHCVFEHVEKHKAPLKSQTVWIIRKMRRRVSDGELKVSYFHMFKEHPDVPGRKYVTTTSNVKLAKLLRSYEEAEAVLADCRRFTPVKSVYEIVERRKEYERCGIVEKTKGRGADDGTCGNDNRRS